MSSMSLPEALQAALHKYHEQLAAMSADQDVRARRQQVQDLTHRLQAVQNKLDNAEKPYRQKMKDLAEYIEGHALEVEESFDFAGVEVKYRAGYERSAYNAKRLDELVASLRSMGEHTIANDIQAAHRPQVVKAKVTIVTTD